MFKWFALIFNSFQSSLSHIHVQSYAEYNIHLSVHPSNQPILCYTELMFKQLNMSSSFFVVVRLYFNETVLFLTITADFAPLFEQPN